MAGVDPSGWHLWQISLFAGYLLLIAIGGPFLVNLLAYVYSALGTYHVTETQASAAEDFEKADGEPFDDKLALVLFFHLTAVFVTLAVLVLLFHTSTDSSKITGEVTLGLGLLAMTTNVVLRIGAFLEYAYRLQIAPADVEPHLVKSRVLSFGYSLVLSMLATVVLGGGFAILTGQVGAGLQGGGEMDLVKAVWYPILFFGWIVGLTWVSEKALHRFGVYGPLLKPRGAGDAVDAD